MAKIVIGTRGSKLALIQSELAASALKATDASVEIEMKIITPQGDRDKTSPIPLDTIGKGWFSQEIEGELLDGRIDIAVHSLKDMLTELPKGLVIGAYLPRADARDVLLTKNGEPLENLRRGAVIGTDSSRRQTQMKALRPDVVMKSVRGNVPSRIDKLHSEDYDAIILAAAGLERLHMLDSITRYFEPHEITPAPGQGTIAIEARADDTELLALLAKVNDADAADSAHIERSFSDVIGGGCKAPTGAYAWREGGMWHLMGMAQGPDGSILREVLAASADKKDSLGATLAEKFLSKMS
jgi:hydroxymethylbilane synthase